jgi:hypothetical protein
MIRIKKSLLRAVTDTNLAAANLECFRHGKRADNTIVRRWADTSKLMNSRHLYTVIPRMEGVTEVTTAM